MQFCSLSLFQCKSISVQWLYKLFIKKKIISCKWPLWLRRKSLHQRNSLHESKLKIIRNDSQTLLKMKWRNVLNFLFQTFFSPLPQNSKKKKKNYQDLQKRKHKTKQNKCAINVTIPQPSCKKTTRINFGLPTA